MAKQRRKNMKNRRIAVIAIILVAVLCIGIGYARLTDDLFVNGSLTADKTAADEVFKEDIHFGAANTVTMTKTSIDETTDTSAVTVSVEKDENDHANDKLVITVPAKVLNFKNDTLTIVAPIYNDSTEFDALVAISETSNQDLATVTCTFENSASSTTIAKGSSKNVTITIKLNETATKDNYEVVNFAFAISATYGQD